MNLFLKDKIIFITASSAGIGRAIAESFLNEGAYVIINGRNKSKLNNTCNEFEKKFGWDRVWAVQGDMTDIVDIKRVLEEIKEQWGHLDILIGNLGTGRPLSKDKLDINEWQSMMNINLLSTVELLRITVDTLLNMGGNVVLLSSLAAFERIDAPPAYAAAKKGILSLIKYMSFILAEKEIRINGVAPGNVYYEGGRWEELFKLDENGVKKYINKEVPMKRFGKTEEIANAVVFLASERSSFTTGAVLNVDGGQRKGY